MRVGNKPFLNFAAAYAKIAGAIGPGGHRFLQVARIEDSYTLAFCPKRFFDASPGVLSPFANVQTFLTFVEQKAGKNIRDLAELGAFPLLYVELRESTQPGQGNFSQYLAGLDEAFSLAEQLKNEGRQLVYLKQEKLLVLANMTEPLPQDTPPITVHFPIKGQRRQFEPRTITAAQNAQVLLDFLTDVQPAPAQVDSGEAARKAEALQRRRVLPELSDRELAQISVDLLPPDTSRTQGQTTDSLEIIHDLSAAAFSDLGLERKNNEDGFVILKISDDLSLYLVVDGMGGQANGEAASHITALYIASYLKSRLSHTDLSTVALNEEIEKAVAFAQRKIKTIWPDEKGLNRPGSTVVGALVDHKTGETTVFHVGDSRTYLLAHQDMALLTKDHTTAVEDLIEEGRVAGIPAHRFAFPRFGTKAIEEFEAALKAAETTVAPQYARSLSRAVGEPRHAPDIGKISLCDGELLLLCSDGLNRALTNQEILEIINAGLAQGRSLVKIAQDLKERALAKTEETNKGPKHLARDNITVILFYQNILLAKLESSDPAALAEIIDGILFGSEDIDTVALPLARKRLRQIKETQPALAPQITDALNFLEEF